MALRTQALPPTPPPVDERRYGAAVAAFEAALRRRPDAVRERCYRVAGRIVRLRIVGTALADEIEEPFEHLRDGGASGERPILTMDIWHEAETGVPPEPAAGPAPTTLGPYGVMAASADGRFVAEHRPHSAAWLDRRSRRAVAWVSSLDRLYLDERARPFHRLMAVSLGDLGVQFIHAGLVASHGRGALFVGMGGSGKSTSCIACLFGGLAYLGDDFMGLAAEADGSFTGYSLYGSALINLGHMGRYPALAAACRPGHHPDEDKSIVCFARLGCGRLGSEAVIRAIVLPRVVRAEETVYRRASAREALLALAPSSVLYLPGGGPRSMERLGALVERVPSYRLELGRDVGRIPEAVQQLLAEVQRP